MLRDGLYEQVINKSLDEELNSTDKLTETALIDTAEAAKIFSKYIADVVERGLLIVLWIIQIEAVVNNRRIELICSKGLIKCSEIK